MAVVNTLDEERRCSKHEMRGFLCIAMATATDPAQHLGGRYTARENEDGTVDLLDVPIVGELEKGEREDLPDFEITEEWLNAALMRAQERAKEGYMPPLHVRHHSSDTIAERAGFFLPTRVGDFTLGGKPTKTIFANFLRLQKDVAARVMRGELPYCSVEVLNTNRSPEIDSLALLDSEPPQFRYPLITIGRLMRAAGQRTVSMHAVPCGRAAVAFASIPDQNAAAVISKFPSEGASMSASDAAPDTDDMPPWAAKFAQMINEGIEAALSRHFQAAKDAEPEPAALDGSAAHAEPDGDETKLAATKEEPDGDETKLAAATDDEPEPEAPAQAAAAEQEPAVPRFVDPTLEGEDAKFAASSAGKLMAKMEKRHRAELSATRGEIAGLKARLAERDKQDTIKARLEKAIADLQGVNIDDETRKDLRAAAEAGQETTDRFVAMAKRAFGRDPGRFEDLTADADMDENYPDEVEAFRAQGTEALAQARMLFKHYQTNTAKGLVRMSLKRYLDCNVATQVETRPAARLASSRN